MKNQLILILLFCHFFVKAQITPRNILATKYSLENVQKALIAKNQWNPYPKTPTEWRAAVPDSVLNNLVKEGEKVLNFKFEPISGTTSLDFVRSGDRERHGSCLPKALKIKDVLRMLSSMAFGQFAKKVIGAYLPILEAQVCPMLKIQW
jgi:hypothetical protein